LKLSLKRRRVAVSEIIGTLIMIAITLVAGAAVFGFVNGQAKNAEGAYGASVANNVNFLRERFSPVSQLFTGSGGGACSGGTAPYYQCLGASFWIYNNGAIAFTLGTIQIKNLTDIPASAANPNPLNIVFYTVCSTSSSSCGFIAYNKAGSTTICSSNAALPTLNGFYQKISGVNSVPATLALNTLSSNPYQITMPTTATCSAGAQYLYDTVAYVFTFTGLYGNVYQTTLTVNG